MAPASKGALLNIHYYYYYYIHVIQSTLGYTMVRPWAVNNEIQERAFLHEMAQNPQLTDKIFQNNLNTFSQFVSHK